MTKNTPSGVTVAYAHSRWAIMFPESMADLDQWLPAAQALMADLRASFRILPGSPEPTPPPQWPKSNSKPMPKKKTKKPKKY